jgi:hypothetical protein
MVWYHFFHNPSRSRNRTTTGHNDPSSPEENHPPNDKAEEYAPSNSATNTNSTTTTDDDQSRIDPLFLKAWWTRRLQIVEQAQQQKQQRHRSSSSSSTSSTAAAAAATSACYLAGHACGGTSSVPSSGGAAGASSSNISVGGWDNSSVGVSVADTDCTPVISNAKPKYNKQKPSLSSIPQISSFAEADEENNHPNHKIQSTIEQEGIQEILQQRKRKRLLVSTLCFLLILFSTAAAVVAILQYQKQQQQSSTSAKTTHNENDEENNNHNDATTTLVPTMAATNVQFQQTTRPPNEDDTDGSVSVTTTTSSSSSSTHSPPTPAPTRTTAGIVLETHTLGPSSDSSPTTTTNDENKNTTAAASSSEQDWVLVGEYPNGAFGSTLGMVQDTIIISSSSSTPTNVVASMYRFTPEDKQYHPILTGSSSYANSTTADTSGGTVVAMTRGTTASSNMNTDTVPLLFAVSQPTQTIGGQPRRGMVQLYQTTTTDTETAIPWGTKLHGPGAYANFGHAIDLVSSSRGPYLAVGAPYYTQSLRLQGMVSVYEYQEQNQQWTILGGNDDDDDDLVGNHANEWWGSAVALCEHEQHLYVAASAPREEVETQGYVALYEYVTSTTTTNSGGNDAERDATSFGDSHGIWVLIGFVSNIEVVDATSPDRAANVNDQFGASLDLQCENQRVRLIIGIPQVQDGAGMVVVYEYSSSSSNAGDDSSSSSISWTRLGDPIIFYSQDAVGTTSSAEFGTSVVWIDENTLAVGAPGAKDRTGAVEIWQLSVADDNSGSNYFQWVDTQWGREQGDEFGSSLVSAWSMRRLNDEEDPQSVLLLAAGAPQTSRQGQTGYVRIWNVNNPEEPLMN